MAQIAAALPPKSPVRGTGVLYFRVYGVTPDGTRYPLPPDVTPEPGKCIIPGCDCGGPDRER